MTRWTCAKAKNSLENHDDLVSVLLPLATKTDWIKYVDESYNVMTSMLEVNFTHSPT